MTEDRKQYHARFAALLTGVAAQLRKLGEGAVQFEDTTSADDFRCSGKLVHPEFALDVYGYRDGYSANAKDRVKFSGSWPRPKNGAYKRLRDYGIGDYNSSDPEISVSIEGTPERIAKDVVRRLINGEDIRGKYAAVLAKQAETAAYLNRKEQLAKELFALAGQQPPKTEPGRDIDLSIRLYDFAPGVNYGDVRVNGDDSVRFEVSVDGPTAKRLIVALKELRA